MGWRVATILDGLILLVPFVLITLATYTYHVIHSTSVVAQALAVSVCDERGGQCDELTPEYGDRIGPGPFTKTYTYTPLTFDTYTIQATVSDISDPALVSTTASSSFRIPSAALLVPVDGLAGPQINPQFTWQGGPNQTFATVLSKVNGKGRMSDFLGIEPAGYQRLPSDSWYTTGGLPDSGSLTSLDGVATMSVDANGSGELQLDSPLPPGRYAWRVVSAGSAGAWSQSTTESPRRTFTVRGPRLTGLKVRAIARPGRTSGYPGYTALRITTTPYSKVQIAFTRRGRTTSVVQYWGKRNQGDFPIDWSCSRPDGRIRYTVTASDHQGHSMTRRGQALTITSARCTKMRAAEQAPGRFH